MSCIAVKKYIDKIVISADSLLTNNSGGKRLLPGFTKLKRSGNYHSIVVGSAGYMDELSLMFQFIEEQRPASTSRESVLKYFIDFRKYKSEVLNDNNAKIENSYIFIYEDKVFEITDMSVIEIQHIAAIGSGMDYAMAALHLGHTPEEAVKVSCELCYYVGEPIVTIEIHINPYVHVDRFDIEKIDVGNYIYKCTCCNKILSSECLTERASGNKLTCEHCGTSSWCVKREIRTRNVTDEKEEDKILTVTEAMNMVSEDRNFLLRYNMVCPDCGKIFENSSIYSNITINDDLYCIHCHATCRRVKIIKSKIMRIEGME